MKASRRLTFTLTLTFVLLAGFALWYFHSAPVPPQAAPIAKTTTALPVEQRRPEPVAAQPSPSEAAPVAPIPTPTAAPQPAPQTPAQPLAQRSADQTTKPASPADTPPDEPRRSSKSEDGPETAATARMYAAHSSLRTPEVADPDSKSNKQILQTMVLKALSQPATPPPTSAATPSAKL